MTYSAKKVSRVISYQSKYCHESPPDIFSKELPHHSLQQASPTQTLVLGNVSSTHAAPAEKALFERSRSTRVQQEGEPCVKHARLTPVKKQHPTSPIGAQKATNTLSATLSAKKLFTPSKSSSAKLKDDKLKPTTSTDLEIAIKNSSSPQVLTGECNSSDSPTKASELEGRSLLDTFPTSEAIGSTDFCQVISHEKFVTTQSNKVFPEQTSTFLRKSIGKKNCTDATEQRPPKSLDKQPSHVKSSSGIDSQKYNFSKRHSQDLNKFSQAALISRRVATEQKTSAFSPSGKFSEFSVSSYDDSAACAPLQQASLLTSLGGPSTSWLTSWPPDGFFENTKTKNNLEKKLFWADPVNSAAFPFEAHMDFTSCKDYEMLMAVEECSNQNTVAVPKFPEEYPEFGVIKNEFLSPKRTLKTPLTAMPATKSYDRQPISCPSEELSTSCVEEPLSSICTHLSASPSTCIPDLKPNPNSLPDRKLDPLSSIGELCTFEQNFSFTRQFQISNSLDKLANAVVNKSFDADNQFFWVEKPIGFNLRNLDENPQSQNNSAYLNTILDKEQQIGNQAEISAGFASSSPFLSSTGKKTVLRTDWKESQTDEMKSSCFGGAAGLDSLHIKQQEVVSENTCNGLADSVSEITHVTLSAGEFPLPDVALSFAIADPSHTALSDAKFWSPKYSGGFSAEDSGLASAPESSSDIVLKDEGFIEVINRQQDMGHYPIQDATVVTSSMQSALSFTKKNCRRVSERPDYLDSFSQMLASEQNLQLSRKSEISLIGSNLEQKLSTSEQQCSIFWQNDHFPSQLERADNKRTVDVSFNSIYQSPGNYITHHLEESLPAPREDLQQYPTLLEKHQCLPGEGLLMQDESCSLTSLQNPTREFINYLEGKTCEHNAADNFSDLLETSQEDEPLFWPLDLKYYWDDGNSEQKLSSITDFVGLTDRASSITPCLAITESAQVFSVLLEGETLKAVNSSHANQNVLGTEACALENEGSLTSWETDTKDEQLSGCSCGDSCGEGLNCSEDPESYLREEIPRGEISGGGRQAMEWCESPEHPKYSPSVTSSTDSDRTSFVWDSGSFASFRETGGFCTGRSFEIFNKVGKSLKWLNFSGAGVIPVANAKVWAAETEYEGKLDELGKSEHAEVEVQNRAENKEKTTFLSNEIDRDNTNVYSKKVSYYDDDEEGAHVDERSYVSSGGIEALKHSFRHEWIPVKHNSIEHSFGNAHTDVEHRDVANRLNDYGHDSQKFRIDENGQGCNCPSKSGECEMLAGERCHEQIQNGQLCESRVKNAVEDCQFTKFRHERSWQEEASITRPSAHGLSIYKNPLWTEGLHPTGRSNGQIGISSLPITPMETLSLSDQEDNENDIDNYADFVKGCAWICDEKAIFGQSKSVTQGTVKGLVRGSQTFYIPQDQLDSETTKTSEVERFAKGASDFSADLQNYDKYFVSMTDEEFDMLAGKSRQEKERFTRTNPSLPSSLHSNPEKEYQLSNSHLKPSEMRISDSKQPSNESNRSSIEVPEACTGKKKGNSLLDLTNRSECARRFESMSAYTGTADKEHVEERQHAKPELDMVIVEGGGGALWSMPRKLDAKRRDQKCSNKVEKRHLQMVHNLQRWVAHGKMQEFPPTPLKPTSTIGAIAVCTPQFTRNFGSVPVKAVPRTFPHPRSDMLIDEQAEFSAPEDHQLKILAPSYQGCVRHYSSAETKAVDTNSEVNVSQEGTQSNLVADWEKLVDYWLDPSMGRNGKNVTVLEELCDSKVQNNGNGRMEKAKTAGSKRTNREVKPTGSSNIQGMLLKTFCGELAPEPNQGGAPFEIEELKSLEKRVKQEATGRSGKDHMPSYPSLDPLDSKMKPTSHTRMKHTLEWSNSGSIQKHSDFQGCSDAMTHIEESSLENVRSRTEGVPNQAKACDATEAKDVISIISPQGSKLSSLEDPDCCLESPGSMASELVQSFFLAGKRQRNHKPKRNKTGKPAESPKNVEKHASERRMMVLEEEISKIHAKNKKLESIVKEMEENAKLAAQEKEAWEQQKTSEMENLSSYKSAQCEVVSRSSSGLLEGECEDSLESMKLASGFR